LLHPRQNQGSEQEGFLTTSFIGNNSMLELWELVTEDAGVSLLHLSHPETPKKKVLKNVINTEITVMNFVIYFAAKRKPEEGDLPIISD
jgi:hypothetical protein